MNSSKVVYMMLAIVVGGAGPKQGGCFQDFLKQEVSRKGHRDVLVPCPENTPLVPHRLVPVDDVIPPNTAEPP